MTDPKRATEELLAEKPAAEEPLRELVRVDEDGPWTFDDVGVDSGTFGEIVSRGIVGEAGDAYRLADRDAVRAALDGEAAATDAESAAIPDVDAGSWIADRLPSRTHAGALAGCLALVVVLRALLIGSVFRGGDVVLAGNDPWGYRYWVELLLERAVGPLNLDAVSELLGTGISADYLYVILLWWLAAAAGGTPGAAAVVLAWLPVLLAVCTAGVVYAIAVRLTADRRIGLAAVVMLALTPIHAYRSMVGFGDHHALDYLLVSVTALGLVVLATERTRSGLDVGTRQVPLPASRTEWAGACLLGVGVASQVLAWRGGPLLLPLILAYAGYRAYFDAVTDRSPAVENATLLAGLALGAALGAAPLVLFGWPSLVRAISPALLAVAAAGAIAAGEASHRLDRSPRATLGAAGLAGVLVAVGVARLPVVSAMISRGIAYFARTGRSNIAETLSLFGGEVGSILGPVLFFGLLLFLALPYLGLAVRRVAREYRPGWAVAAAYALYFLVLSAVQLRFAGHLAAFSALFAGVGFVHVAARIDLIPAPAVFSEGSADPRGSTPDAVDDPRSFALPEWRTAGYLAVLLLLVGSLSFVQIPVKQSQLAVDDGTYRTATWTASYADRHDLDASDRYVFSRWGRNRVYNYFVSGNSRSYRFAQENYELFLSSSDAEGWYHRLRGRVGFIVTRPRGGFPDESMQARLHRRYGSAGKGTDGSGHYRVIHVASGGDRVVSTLVPGARIVGVASPGVAVTLTANVTIDGEETTYERRVEANRYGLYDATVAYPGRYVVRERVARVSERDVTASGRVVLHDRPGVAHWPFDAGRGGVIADRVGGYGGRITGADWTAGVEGSALRFSEPGDGVDVNGSFDLGERSVTVSFWIRGDLGTAGTRYPTVVSTRDPDGAGFGVWARNGVPDFGVRFDGPNGTTVKNFGIATNEFPGWTHVVAVLDREAGEVRLYRNGTLVATTAAGAIGPIRTEGMEIGTRNGGNHGPAHASIDDLRIREGAASTREVRQWFNRSAGTGASPG